VLVVRATSTKTQAHELGTFTELPKARWRSARSLALCCVALRCVALRSRAPARPQSLASVRALFRDVVEGLGPCFAVSYDRAGKSKQADLRVINAAISDVEFQKTCMLALEASSRNELTFHVEKPAEKSIGRNKEYGGVSGGGAAGKTAADIAALAAGCAPVNVWAKGTPLGDNFAAVSESDEGVSLPLLARQRWAAAVTYANGTGEREWDSLTKAPPADRLFYSAGWPRNPELQKLRLPVQQTRR
jgi:hypothetical protein